MKAMQQGALKILVLFVELITYVFENPYVIIKHQKGGD
jgi:hypothetical protein